MASRNKDGPLSSSNSNSDEGARGWRAVKWAVGILVGGGAVIFGAGKSWTANATKFDLEARVNPVEVRVTAIESAMEPIKAGIDVLVGDRNRAAHHRALNRQLRSHDVEYAEALKSWEQHGQGQRPRKSEHHLRLIDEVQTAKDRI